MSKPTKPNIPALYKKMHTPGFRFYCVGCNRERRHSSPARVGSPLFFTHILITTAFMTLLTWPWMHWKGFFAFLIPVGVALEGFYRMKMRGALICPDCSFDPVLYLSNPEKAVRQVEASWRKKFQEKGLTYPEPARRGGRRKEEILTSI